MKHSDKVEIRDKPGETTQKSQTDRQTEQQIMRGLMPNMLPVEEQVVQKHQLASRRYKGLILA